MKIRPARPGEARARLISRGASRPVAGSRVAAAGDMAEVRVTRLDSAGCGG
jgi:hypothetical protein